MFVNESAYTDQPMKTALILSGGGARAAYQAGVLKALMEIYPREDFPFDIVCGTSAGAINAVFLAAHADQPRSGVDKLTRAWRGLRPRDVYQVGWWDVLKRVFNVLRGPFSSDGRGAPASLLDNTPLRHLLLGWLDFDAVRRNIEAHHLESISVTAMDYADGNSIAFFESSGDYNWARLYRRGRHTRLAVEHVMASAAIPILFPAERIESAHFGDGALRQLHPISPALKFGAERLFVIGVSAREKRLAHQIERRRPTIGQMAGHLLNREFIDNLEADIELARRFNRFSDALTDAQRDELEIHPIETFVLTPSIHFGEIAADYMSEQPAALKLFFRLLGASQRGAGASFASYLMFDGAYCERLMACGYADACADRERIESFFTPHESNE